VNLSEIVNRINILADEQESMDMVAGFVNDAIAKINIRLKANFPSLVLATDEPIFPEKWQRALLIPFGVGRIKQWDSSQFEYTDAYNEFLANLEDMAAQYVVPELFKDREGEGYIDPITGEWKSYTSDVYTTPPTPWGGRW
jgi:hypothetical protein